MTSLLHPTNIFETLQIDVNWKPPEYFIVLG